MNAGLFEKALAPVNPDSPAGGESVPIISDVTITVAILTIPRGAV